MKGIYQTPLVFLLLLAQGYCVKAQDTKVDHLVAFAKLAGDIQFFSPSDAANNAVWWRIYPNTVKSVLGATDEQAFVDTLASIFEPVEPGLTIRYKGQTVLKGQVAQEPGPLVVTAQHSGLDLWSGSYRQYRSMRTNRRSPTSATDMSETRFKLVPVSSDTTERALTLVFRYAMGEVPMEVTVSRDGEQRLRDSLDASDTVFVFNDTLRRGTDNVLVAVYTDQDKGFSADLDTALAYVESNGIAGVANNSASTVYTVEFFSNDLPLYDERHQIGDTLSVVLNSNITASFPLAVYADDEHTLPVSEAVKTGYRYDTNPSDGDGGMTLTNKYLRIANVIQVWNAMRLSYAYFPLDAKELDRVLSKTLAACMDDITLQEYHKVVWAMLSEFKDSHIFFAINDIDAPQTHSVPMQLVPIDGKVFVKKIDDSALKMQLGAGDEILALNGVPVNLAVDSLMALTSGAERHRNWLAVHRLLHGPEQTVVDIRVKKAGTGEIKDVTAVRSMVRDGYPEGVKLLNQRGNRFITPSTYYFDVTTAEPNDTLISAMNNPDMNVIVDMRGYLSGQPVFDVVMENLVDDTVKTHNIFRPKIYGPGNIGWDTLVNVYTPGLRNSKEKADVFILTDVSAMSAPETMLDVIKTFKLATIIGEPTAGGNGSINGLYLPGGMSVTFSGEVFKNSDGTIHHLHGVKPDYPVDYEYEDLLTGTDPFLERALTIIREKEIK